jgi:hypothetical protein
MLYTSTCIFFFQVIFMLWTFRQWWNISLPLGDSWTLATTSCPPRPFLPSCRHKKLTREAHPAKGGCQVTSEHSGRWLWMTGASNRVWTSGLWSREPSVVARLLRQQGKSGVGHFGLDLTNDTKDIDYTSGICFISGSTIMNMEWHTNGHSHNEDLDRFGPRNPVKTLLPLEARSTYYALFWCVYVLSHLLIVIACVLSAPYHILYTRTGGTITRGFLVGYKLLTYQG